MRASSKGLAPPPPTKKALTGLFCWWAGGMCFGVHAAVAGYARDGPPPPSILTLRSLSGTKAARSETPAGRSCWRRWRKRLRHQLRDRDGTRRRDKWTTPAVWGATLLSCSQFSGDFGKSVPLRKWLDLQRREKALNPGVRFSLGGAMRSRGKGSLESRQGGAVVLKCRKQCARYQDRVSKPPE